MLARPKLGDGRPCLPDRPRMIASKDHVGTGAPARPVERSSTSGGLPVPVRSFAGGRGRPPLRGRADPARWRLFGKALQEVSRRVGGLGPLFPVLAREE